jgi:hypothetical protein
MTGRDLLWELAPNLFPTETDDPRRTSVLGLLDTIAGRPGERPEDVLLDLQLVDDRRLALALALRSGLRFEGLRDFTPDERLFLYLPLSIAMAERLLPLALSGDTLVVATAFVDADLSYLSRNFPNLEVEQVIAPRNDILEALQRVTR